jgi:hypothetical protein
VHHQLGCLRQLQQLQQVAIPLPHLHSHRWQLRYHHQQQQLLQAPKRLHTHKLAAALLQIPQSRGQLL